MLENSQDCIYYINMLGPYRMVVVNIAALLLFFGGVLIYRYLYPKKKINLFLLLIIVSILPVISIFRQGVYESGDFNLHIYRAMAFYDSLRDGQYIPSWAGDLNATYGYPLFTFNYTFPYYIISLFHFLGFTFIASMKLYLAITYILSGIFMYFWIKSILKNSLGAFVSSIFYLFAPYHLVDLHFRVTVGELGAFFLLPLFLLLIFNLIIKQTRFLIVSTAIVFILLFLSHPATTIFSFLLIAPTTFFYMAKNNVLRKKTILSLIIVLVVGLLTTSFIWIPYLFLAKYTNSYILTSQTVTFTNFIDLLRSPWRYGLLFQGPKGELSFLIGYTQIFVILLAIIMLAKRKIKKAYRPQVLFWIILTSVIIFMITPLSKFIWQALPILNIAQFSYRFLLLAAIAISVLVGYLTLHFLKKPWFLYALVTVTIAYTMLNWGNRRVIPQINNDTLKNNMPKSTSEGEALCCIGSPKWVDKKNPWMSKIPNSHIEIVNGNGELKEIYRNSVEHHYISFSQNLLFFKENTLYFPGWYAKVDGKSIPIFFENKKNQGIITFEIQKGLHYIEVSYDDVPVLKISKILGGFCIIALFILFFFELTKSFFLPKIRNLF